MARRVESSFTAIKWAARRRDRVRLLPRGDCVSPIARCECWRVSPQTQDSATGRVRRAAARARPHVLLGDDVTRRTPAPMASPVNWALLGLISERESYAFEL